MSMRITLALLLVPALAAGALAGQQKAEPRKAAGQQSGFEAFKKLAGEWVGKGASGPVQGEEVRISYRVTSGGSAVVETEFPGTDHEMLTLIHPDGNDLLLTHYCHLGNQPQMRAPGKMDGNRIAFKFVRATNMKSDRDMHMHEVTYTFVDDDTLRAEWMLYQDGKPAGPAAFELKRKK
jgi:hypothetical protein